MSNNFTSYMVTPYELQMCSNARWEGVACNTLSVDTISRVWHICTAVPYGQTREAILSFKLTDPSNISQVSQKQCWYGMLNNLAFLILWYFRKFHGSITIKSLIGYWKKMSIDIWIWIFFQMFQTFLKCADNDWVIFCIYIFTFSSLPCWTDWRSITIYLYLFIL